MLKKNSKSVAEYNACTPLGKRMKRAGSLALLSAPLLLPAVSLAAADSRPNIVLLVADDVGYSDFASFGGEAETPTMDSLADIGKTFTNFHAMPNCSPSRSVFMTGIDNHINGVGTFGFLLTNPANPQVGTPGYSGFVNSQSLMTSELLQDAGYHTYMVGKWHLGEDTEVDGQPVHKLDTWPIGQGFEHSFGILNGGSDHFGSLAWVAGTTSAFFEDDRILLPRFDFGPNYFTAIGHTDKALEFIDAGIETDTERKPFFLYYADTMAHDPNQLPRGTVKQEYIDMYYQKGWGVIRAERFERMQDLGILPDTLTLPAARIDDFPAWDNVNDPKWEPLMKRVTEPPYDVTWGNIETVNDLKWTLAKKMAVYTGMVEMFDSQANRIVTHLKDIGEYENTVFIYFSDNGGDSREWDFQERNDMLHRGDDNSFENIGNPGSRVANGRQWAQAVNTPLYGAKATTAEGGLRVPLVIAYPGGNIEQASRNSSIATVADIAATVLDFANVQHPAGVGVKPDWNNCTGAYAGATNICPMNGKSLRTVLNGSAQSLHAGEPIGYEMFGRAARQDGKIIGDQPNKALYYEGEDGVLWKVLRLGDAGWGAGVHEPWQLFNLTEDITESNDLGAEMPEKLAMMMEMYHDYELSVSVIPQSAKKEKGVAPGSDVSFQYQMSNLSGEPEDYTLSCQSDWPCTISSVLNFTLAAGESTNIDVIVSVPGNAGGLTRTAQVTMMRENHPEMTNNQILVVQADEARMTGDFNGDGAVNIHDLNVFQQYYINQDLKGDLDGSGVVNVFDLHIFQMAYTEYQRSLFNFF